MTTYSDTFTGTGALSGSWTVVGANSASRSSDKASVGASTAIFYTDAATGAQFSEADLPTGTGSEPGIFVCSNNNFSYPFIDGYLWRGNGSGPGWHLWRDGVEVATEATASEYLPGNIEDGGRIRIEHDGAGTVRIYHNGVHFATYVDGTPLTALKFGLFSGQSSLFDNWEGGDLTPITDPTDIAGCVLWLDADDAGTITTSGTEITAWDDKSASAETFIRGVGMAGPDYTASVLNGKAAAVWNANNTGFRCETLTIPQPYTAFLVMEFASLSGNIESILIAPNAGGAVGLRHHPADLFWLDGGASGFDDMFEIAATTPYYISAVMDGASSSAWLNGVNQLSGASIGTGGLEPWVMFGRQDGDDRGLGNLPGSYVCELIVYDSALDDDEVIAVEQYIYDKWFTSGSVDDTAEPSVIAVSTAVNSPTCLVRTFPSVIAATSTVNSATDIVKSTPSVIAVITAVNAPIGLARTFPSAIAVTTTVPSPAPGQYNPVILYVPADTSSTILMAANPARKIITIVNSSTDILYVKFGTTASTSSFTYRIPAGQTLELPSAGVIYTGRLDGIWSGTNGAALVTEMI